MQEQYAGAGSSVLLLPPASAACSCCLLLLSAPAVCPCCLPLLLALSLKLAPFHPKI
jgi:hypothetical protein